MIILKTDSIYMIMICLEMMAISVTIIAKVFGALLFVVFTLGFVPYLECLYFVLFGCFLLILNLI